MSRIHLEERSIDDLPYEIIDIILKFDLANHGLYYRIEDGCVVNPELLTHLKNLRAASRRVCEVIGTREMIELTGALFRTSHLRWLIRCNTQIASRDLITESAAAYWGRFVTRCLTLHAIGAAFEGYHGNDYQSPYQWVFDVVPEVAENPLIIYCDYFGPHDKAEKLAKIQQQISQKWYYGDYRRNNRTNYPSPFSSYSWRGTFRNRHRQFDPTVNATNIDPANIFVNTGIETIAGYFTMPLFINKKKYVDLPFSYNTSTANFSADFDGDALTTTGRAGIIAVHNYLRAQAALETDVIRQYTTQARGRIVRANYHHDNKCPCSRKIYRAKPGPSRLDKKLVKKSAKAKKEYPKKMQKAKWNRGPAKNKQRMR